MLPKYGYALVEEELNKDELDHNLLVKQNEILQKKLQVKELDVNANVIDNDSTTDDILHRINRKCGKSLLNVDDLDSSSEILCPGLATAAVTYKLD